MLSSNEALKELNKIIVMLLLTDFDIRERFTDLNLQTDSPFVRCIYVPDKYRPTEAQTL